MTATLELQMAVLTEQVAALRKEVAHLRDEVGFEGALLRQDVANKILSLGRSLATRYELIQLIRKVHRQLLVLRADLQQPRREPATQEWFEVRTMDSAPMPWERKPKEERGDERHDTEVSPAPGGAERSRHTLVLEDPRPCAVRS
jgi:hypothetical protein